MRKGAIFDVFAGPLGNDTGRFHGPDSATPMELTFTPEEQRKIATLEAVTDPVVFFPSRSSGINRKRCGKATGEGGPMRDRKIHIFENSFHSKTEEI